MKNSSHLGRCCGTSTASCLAHDCRMLRTPKTYCLSQTVRTSSSPSHLPGSACASCSRRPRKWRRCRRRKSSSPHRTAASSQAVHAPGTQHSAPTASATARCIHCRRARRPQSLRFTLLGRLQESTDDPRAATAATASSSVAAATFLFSSQRRRCFGKARRVRRDQACILAGPLAVEALQAVGWRRQPTRRRRGEYRFQADRGRGEDAAAAGAFEALRASVRWPGRGGGEDGG